MSRWSKEKRRFKKDSYHGQHWNLGDFIVPIQRDDAMPVDCLAGFAPAGR